MGRTKGRRSEFMLAAADTGDSTFGLCEAAVSSGDESTLQPDVNQHERVARERPTERAVVAGKAGFDDANIKARRASRREQQRRLELIQLKLETD